MEDTYCPNCGEPIDDETSNCPGCGIEHLSTSRLQDLLDSAEKNWRSGEGLARSFPPLALLIAYRQRGIEKALRELLEYRNRFESPVYCRGCGEELVAEAAHCEECSHENELATIEALDVVVDDPADAHDPADYETDVSGTWWYGVLGGPILSMGSMGVDPSAPAMMRALAMGLLIVGGIIGIGSVFYDRRYVRANGPWHPSAAWAGLQWIPGVSLVVAIIYLLRRRLALG